MKIQDIFNEEGMTTVVNINPGPFIRKKKKKKKKKKEEEIVEGLSPILYHATSFKSFVGIMNSNEIRLSKGLQKGTYYMSFSRSRNSDFLQYLNNMRDHELDEESFNPREDAFVVMQMDGRALSSNFSGGAFDTFAYDGEDDYGRPAASDFMEDRLVSNSPVIKNPSRYIKSISLVNGSEVPDTTLVKLVGLFGANFSMYDTLQDYMKNRVRER